MRRKLIGLMATMAMVAASCAGGSSGATTPEVSVTDAESNGATSTEGAATEDVSAAEEGAKDDPYGELDFGDGMAVVIVADTRYEFTMGRETGLVIAVCSSIVGAVQATGYDTEGRAITVEMWIPPTDWESYDDERYDPPRIEIEDIEGNGGWKADLAFQRANPDAIAAGSYQVDDYVNDGYRASGSATFLPMEPWGSPVEGSQPVQGTFEVQCAQD